MDAFEQQIVSQLLSAVNDGISVRAYGGGLLIDLPFTYGDGDSVRVFVERSGDAIRVTDRAEAADRLASAGINVTGGKAGVAVRTALNALALNQIASSDDEVATVGEVGDAGELIIGVAQTAMRIEQLHWLATAPAERSFVRGVKRALESVKRWTVRTEAAIPMRSGRTRKVTASVEGSQSTALVQALSRADPDRAVQSAYFTFTHLANPRVNRLALLDGRRSDWPDGTDGDLQSASTVLFVADTSDGEIESVVDEMVSAPVLVTADQ